MKHFLTFLLLLSLPAGVGAQGFSLSTFGASNRGLEGSPALAGMAITGWSGPFGLRAGGAVDVASSPVAPMLGYPPASARSAWSGEVDLLLSGGGLGIALGELEPGLLVGFGLHGARTTAGEAATIAAWSYGVSATLPIASWLSLDGEARYRMPHEADPVMLPPGVGGGWELRAGLTIHLGRAPPARPSSRRERASPPRTIHIGDGGRGTAGPAPADDAFRRTASGVLAEGDRYVGVPYVWGGDSPSGFDCSGFVRYVYRHHGIRLPRVSRDQARAGSRLPPRIADVLPGDLLFFAGSDGVIDHVAIYAGNGTILHASGSRGGVGYDRLDSRHGRWYATHLVAARRVIR